MNIDKDIVIRPTGLIHDHNQMYQDASSIINLVGWGDKNQISLNSRPWDNDPWHDGAGSTINKRTGQKIMNEQDFTEWNPLPEFIKKSLLELQSKEKIKFGRIRLMKLESHRGLSVHADFEKRYHYVIQTNIKCYFGFSQTQDQNVPTAICYHIPADGQWYHIDTTKLHFVYNGSNFDRIHLVVCAFNV